ncbi:MAG: flagellar biosynthesis protein FlgA [Rhodospirillaceae bacterium]|nr:flagellar biosynthesis protein FlgA [Rhodospirillaceae bacterium]MBT3926935.1 flagellar biosynthesis protein FlgA [Rhodospirillaceae bacterium]MBT4426651.1 flagellar biosynthesis protein FlgA [Rhodospirillaceae bacterium]MBT5677137.1 flagellar biosynthesis protein FlgA [Rhodospirillaceae bacterium]MBT7292204.1 flagellar biosynthesis protein FlgA [Rhodospirillaceae bacterium]
MNLYRMLARRAEEGRPVRIGVIGAGKFATMFLAQARHTPGMHVMAIADLDVARGRSALAAAGWPANSAEAASFSAALESGATHITEDVQALIAADGMEVVVDATGNPIAGIAHALACIEQGRHIVMVNVEADALAGPLLARRAEAAGLVYSLAYGDQPALIAEQVDWARASGFDVVAAGKGTKYLPGYHHVTPDDVWSHYGIDAAHAAAHGLNAQMFNSFLDGTKSAIEMTAVANATGLTPAPDGLHFPPCGVSELAEQLRPAAEGGLLHHKGQVEVISSLDAKGGEVAGDLRWGVFVVFEAPGDYAVTSFQEYGIKTDRSGRYAGMYKPFHLIGLELGISVASAALRGEPTGAPDGFRGDAVATAKRSMKAGEMLDGEGGYTVYATLTPAEASLAGDGLPIGLAHGVKLRHDIAQDDKIRWSDVDIDLTSEAVKIRREMETAFTPTSG